jgi:excisionase family DNA binding protein
MTSHGCDATKSPTGGISLLTLGEVCHHTRLGKSTIYRLIAAGELPSIKIGRSRRVLLRDVREFVTPASAPDRHHER